MAISSKAEGHVRLRERQDALFDPSICGSLRAVQSAMPFLFEETPGAEGGSTPHSAVRRQETIKAPFAPVQGKQNPSEGERFVPRSLPNNLGGRPRKPRTGCRQLRSSLPLSSCRRLT